MDILTPTRYVVFTEHTDPETGRFVDTVLSVKLTLLAAKRAYLKFGRTEAAREVPSYGFRTEKFTAGKWREI